jgi:hypothetical protein
VWLRQKGGTRQEGKRTREIEHSIIPDKSSLGAASRENEDDENHDETAVGDVVVVDTVATRCCGTTSISTATMITASTTSTRKKPAMALPRPLPNNAILKHVYQELAQCILYSMC